jgi:GntR family transcriptional regulator/MocR family aminotransferase
MARNQSTSSAEVLLNLGGAGPAHRELSDALRTAIQESRLRPNEPLPSSRTLASDLGTSRWVVTEAYAQLIAEGYLAARPGSATRVAARATTAPSRTTTGGVLERGSDASRRQDDRQLDLRPGIPDLAEFPRVAWAKAYVQVLRQVSAYDLGYPAPRGSAVLRQTLSAYLARVRGIDATPDRLVITGGTTQSMMVLSRALATRGITKIATEDPCWPRLPDVAAEQGLQITGVDVDDCGLCVNDLPAIAAAVLVTPAHQFPTGVALSAARRTAVLEWAHRHGGLVIEDDYDAEFRYDRRPLSAIAGLDPDRVAYLGSVSKTLAPGLRLGWMLLPLWLMAVVLNEIPEGAAPNVLDQLALAEFITSGGYDRHLRRMRRHYRERRDALVGALQLAAPGLVLHGVAAGLHLLIELGSDSDEVTAVSRLQRSGIHVIPLQRYQRERARAGLVINYARLPVHRAPQAAHAIAEAVSVGRP